MKSKRLLVFYFNAKLKYLKSLSVKFIDYHELSMNLQCSSKPMNDYMSRTFCTKIKLLLRKTVLKVSLIQIFY